VKTSTLDLGTRCPDCSRRLFFDLDGGGVCLDCTRWTSSPDADSAVPAEPAMPFIALVGSEIVEQADTLDELLAILRDILDDTGPEDVAVWQGPCLLLVLHADGRVTDFAGMGGPR
jgi:hypothetical protein